jgi:hypothetical protein
MRPSTSWDSEPLQPATPQYTRPMLEHSFTNTAHAPATIRPPVITLTSCLHELAATWLVCVIYLAPLSACASHPLILLSGEAPRRGEACPHALQAVPPCAPHERWTRQLEGSPGCHHAASLPSNAGGCKYTVSSSHTAYKSVVVPHSRFSIHSALWGISGCQMAAWVCTEGSTSRSLPKQLTSRSLPQQHREHTRAWC